MAWTNTQKQIAVRACRAAGMDDDARVFILRQFKHAKVGEKITSTAPALTNQDFAEFMSIVERSAGGKILHFTSRYWAAQAGDYLGRLRHRARRIASLLERAGKLAADGAGLAGWIGKRVSQGETYDVEKLDYHQMLALILQLQAYARQNDIDPSAGAEVGAPAFSRDDAFENPGQKIPF